MSKATPVLYVLLAKCACTTTFAFAPSQIESSFAKSTVPWLLYTARAPELEFCKPTAYAKLPELLPTTHSIAPFTSEFNFELIPNFNRSRPLSAATAYVASP